MSRIIVGLDNSKTSEIAFHKAIEQAKWRGSTVHAVHVVHQPFSAGYYGIEYPGISALLEAGEALIEEELQKFAEVYEGQFPVEVTSEAVFGHSGVQLTRLCNGDESVDPAALVVVGSRGYGAVRGTLLGSVTTYLVHHVSIPMLIIPPEADD